jgi:hypothetical protein
MGKKIIAIKIHDLIFLFFIINYFFIETRYKKAKKNAVYTGGGIFFIKKQRNEIKFLAYDAHARGIFVSFFYTIYNGMKILFF